DRDLLDLAYDLVSKELKDSKSSITFNQICDLIQKSTNMNKVELDSILGSLYTDFLQDPRFVFIGNNKWTLRNLQTLEFLRNNQTALYNYENVNDVKEAYDEEALPQAIIDQDNEVYDENEFEISRDSLDNSSDSDLNDDDEEMKYEYDEN
ncbi:MAG: DNA-directed RNA polymerase subunit delta, partial [Ureaplasma sp.]|nr:DNA-directed RNA polymerase subunit delta [Ureaplasma sp.]